MSRTRNLASACLTLSRNDTKLVLCPALGGAIVSLQHRQKNVLRNDGLEALASQNVRAMASYPLLPYSNRIAYGKFNWYNQHYQLEQNFGDHPHPLHGHGWQQAWQIVSQSTEQAVLQYEHQAGAAGMWPFSFRAEQHFSLRDDGLDMELHFTNLADDTAPVGLGWHPYFERSADLCLQFQAQQVWLQDDTHLPTMAITPPEDWNFASEKALDPAPAPYLDHCFAGWDGYARLYYPTRQLAITLRASEQLNHLVVFTPEHGHYIAVEPVSHRNNAINDAHPLTQGLQALPAGASTSVRCSIQVEHL
ncbi:aldose 1-epimerase [Neisseriaceae bacterium TC5R-5]|nr:aldose 1-epimerase [Neisseriaceae bacterium TC5R-5]